MESIENFLRVKNLEPQLDKTLENIRNINQGLCKHLSPEQLQKQHQYFTSHQFRIVNIKKSLNLYYNKCMLKPPDIKTRSLSKIPAKSHRSITRPNSSPSLPLDFETFSRAPIYHNTPFENPAITKPWSLDLSLKHSKSNSSRSSSSSCKNPNYTNSPQTNSSRESSSNKSHSSASHFDFDDEYIALETLNEKQKQSEKATLLVSQAEESCERKIRQLEIQNQLELEKQKALEEVIQARNVAKMRALDLKFEKIRTSQLRYHSEAKSNSNMSVSNKILNYDQPNSMSSFKTERKTSNTPFHPSSVYLSQSHQHIANTQSASTIDPNPNTHLESTTFHHKFDRGKYPLSN